MTRIQGIFLVFLLALTGGWATAVVLPETATVFGARVVAVDYTGLMALAVMSGAMILAMRPAFLEPLFGGLDKGYRLHKWLGISGLVLAVVHWLWVEGPKWLVGLGLLPRPERHGHGSGTETGLLALLHSQRGLAEGVGEWAFYAAVALILLALVKVVPYSAFQRLHRVFPAVYLALVFHGVVLMPPAFWTSVLGPVMVALMVGGVVAALLSLAGRIGRRHTVGGTVERVEPVGEGLVEVTVLVDASKGGDASKGSSGWRGHRTGQFAFVTFDEREGAHPFTIASAWTGDGRLTFLIKALGDYTRTLAGRLTVGDRATVSGPYGRFDFAGEGARQVWIAGGVGITPFLARLEALAAGHKAASSEVDLFYATAKPEPHLIERLRTLSQTAGVRLHVLCAVTDGVLDGERVRRTVPDWQAADVWFCGPAGFGQAMRNALKGGRGRFHQELFQMR